MQQRTIQQIKHTEITVLFYSHDELIVRTSTNAIIFHAWFLNKYQRAASFRLFQKDLLRRRHLTLAEIYGLAAKYDVQCIVDRYNKAATIASRASMDTRPGSEP